LAGNLATLTARRTRLAIVLDRVADLPGLSVRARSPGDLANQATWLTGSPGNLTTWPTGRPGHHPPGTPL